MVGFDEIAEKEGDDKWEEWKKQVLDTSDEIAAFVARQCSRRDGQVIKNFSGSFNFCLRVTFTDAGPDAIIRFPKLGHSTFRDEKVTNEVEVINFLREKTTIPVARLISWGLTKDSPHHHGPFLISDFVDGVHLSNLLKDPAYMDRLYLNPEVDSKLLDNVFEQISDILLQLYQFDFAAIGAISKDSTSNKWSVTQRPLTYSMNELATAAFYPVNEYCNGPFMSAGDYFASLSRQHIIHLRTQRNICSGPSEAKEQYTARHLFASLVESYTIDDLGPFKLFCDDFRPQNILVDPVNLKITAVLDLEFTNAMPSQYASDPPWWLLLAGPDSYLLRGHTMEDFMRDYQPRLEQFLCAMQKAERAKDSKLYPSLSSLMRESWTTKRFWFNYASRKPFDVKELFNSHLNGDRAGLESLDQETRDGLEPFVHMKMEQVKAYDKECDMLSL